MNNWFIDIAISCLICTHITVAFMYRTHLISLCVGRVVNTLYVATGKRKQGMGRIYQ